MKVDTSARALDMQGHRLDRIREDDDRLTMGDKATLRETTAMLFALSAQAPARKMVSGDLFHRSPHTFDDAAWGGGRDDCKRCGVFLNSFYDDEDGCHGPWWMRHQDGGGRAE